MAEKKVMDLFCDRIGLTKREKREASTNKEIKNNMLSKIEAASKADRKAQFEEEFVDELEIEPTPMEDNMMDKIPEEGIVDEPIDNEPIGEEIAEPTGDVVTVSLNLKGMSIEEAQQFMEGLLEGTDYDALVVDTLEEVEEEASEEVEEDLEEETEEKEDKENEDEEEEKEEDKEVEEETEDITE